MGVIVKLLLSFFWLVLVPACAGALFLPPKNGVFPPVLSFLTGYLYLFCIGELLTVPMIFLELPLHTLVWCFGLLAAAAAAGGLFRLLKNRGSLCAACCMPPQNSSGALPPIRAKDVRPKERLLWLLQTLRRVPFSFWAALLLIFIQTAILVYYAHLDADDALYVGAATTAVQTDTLYRVNAYTGELHQLLPRRYIFSPFPIFLAVVSQLAGGLHPSIMAHTVFPAVFLPSAYLVLYLLGKLWFPEDRSMQGIFLLLTAVLAWFSAYSVYNTGSFQMVRIWQGKAVLCAVVLPLIFYLSLTIVMEKQPRYPWFLYLMANCAACLLSTVGILSAPLMMGIFSLMGSLKYRSIRRLGLGLACCLPSILTGAAYLVILYIRQYGYFLY